MLLIAVANGAFRQGVFARYMSELRAHQLSTLTGSILIGLFIRFLIQECPPVSNSHAILIGIVWLVLTIMFEFFMGLVLARRPFSQVLYDYNLLAGRVWVLFLIWIAIAPLVFFRLEG